MDRRLPRRHMGMPIQYHPGIPSACRPKGITLGTLHVQVLGVPEDVGPSVVGAGNLINQRFPRVWPGSDGQCQRPGPGTQGAVPALRGLGRSGSAPGTAQPPIGIPRQQAGREITVSRAPADLLPGERGPQWLNQGLDLPLGPNRAKP